MRGLNLVNKNVFHGLIEVVNITIFEHLLKKGRNYFFWKVLWFNCLKAYQSIKYKILFK